MENKHTSEPWTADMSSKPYAIRAAGFDNSIDRSDVPLGHVFRSHVRGHEGQQKANAQRIAACVNACAGITDPEATVPALLEALRDMLRAYDNDGDMPEMEVDAIIDAARAAIAKANPQEGGE